MTRDWEPGEKVTAHTRRQPARRRFIRVKRFFGEGLVWVDEDGLTYDENELIDPEPAS